MLIRSIPKDVATNAKALPQRPLELPQGLVPEMVAALTSPNRPARVPSGSDRQNLRELGPGSAKPYLRDACDIHLEEGAGRSLCKEGDEMVLWDANRRAKPCCDCK